MSDRPSTIMELLSFSKNAKGSTGWKLGGSYGASISAGLGDFAGVGSSRGKISVSDPSGRHHALDYLATEKYIGVGLGSPLGAEISPETLPSDGLGPLLFTKFWTWNDDETLTLEDLKGAFYEIEIGAGGVTLGHANGANAGSYSLIFMGAPTATHCASLLPGAAFPIILSTCKVFGIMKNTSVKMSTLLEAGGTARCGFIS